MIGLNVTNIITIAIIALLATVAFNVVGKAIGARAAA